MKLVFNDLVLRKRILGRPRDSYVRIFQRAANIKKKQNSIDRCLFLAWDDSCVFFNQFPKMPPGTEMFTYPQGGTLQSL